MSATEFKIQLICTSDLATDCIYLRYIPSRGDFLKIDRICYKIISVQHEIDCGEFGSEVSLVLEAL